MESGDMSPDRPLLPASNGEQSPKCRKMPFKCIMLFTNILLIMLCLGLIACGSMSISKAKLLGRLGDPSPVTGRQVVVAAIASAGIAVVVVLFGSIAIIRKSRAAIVLYAITSCVFMLIFLGLGASVFKIRPTVVKNYEISLTNLFKSTSAVHDMMKETESNRAVYHIQKTFDCCGVDGYGFWQSIDWLKQLSKPGHFVVFRGCCRKMGAQVDDVVMPRCDVCRADFSRRHSRSGNTSLPLTTNTAPTTAKPNNVTTATKYTPIITTTMAMTTGKLNDTTTTKTTTTTTATAKSTTTTKPSHDKTALDCRSVRNDTLTAASVAVYENGCSGVVKTAISKGLQQVGAISLAVAFVQMICVGLSCYISHGLVPKKD